MWLLIGCCTRWMIFLPFYSRKNYSYLDSIGRLKPPRRSAPCLFDSICLSWVISRLTIINRIPKAFAEVLSSRHLFLAQLLHQIGFGIYKIYRKMWNILVTCFASINKNSRMRSNSFRLWYGMPSIGKNQSLFFLLEKERIPLEPFFAAFEETQVNRHAGYGWRPQINRNEIAFQRW